MVTVHKQARTGATGRCSTSTSVLWKWLFHLLFHQLNLQCVIFLLQLEDGLLSSQHRHLQIHSLLQSCAVHWGWRGGAGSIWLFCRSSKASSTMSTKVQCEGFRDASKSNFLFCWRRGWIWICRELKLRQWMFVCESFIYCVVISIFIRAEKNTPIKDTYFQ